MSIVHPPPPTPTIQGITTLTSIRYNRIVLFVCIFRRGMIINNLIIDLDQRLEENREERRVGDIYLDKYKYDTIHKLILHGGLVSKETENQI